MGNCFQKHIIDKHKLTFHESIKLGEDLLFITIF